VVHSLSVSADGFIETPDRRLDWVHVDEELHRHFNDEARDQAASSMGADGVVLLRYER
jgi:hypothetical protein